MVIALFFNSQHPKAPELARFITRLLKEKNISVIADDRDAPMIQATPLSSIKPSQVQYTISLGGDGTLLNIMHTYPALTAPILGINTGHLGFMADVPIEEVEISLEELLKGAFCVDERLILESDDCFAINDFVIHRSPYPSMIELSIHVGGIYVNTFEADGLIISTPNGSTAYSLGAGGPIVSPSLNAIVITPICPHTISNRPIVLTADQDVKIEYLSSYGPVEVRADGLSPFPLSQGTPFCIRRSQRTFKLIHLHSRNYFQTLRTKLNWSGKLR